MNPVNKDSSTISGHPSDFVRVAPRNISITLNGSKEREIQNITGTTIFGSNYGGNGSIIRGLSTDI
jgi:hypothetical protein